MGIKYAIKEKGIQTIPSNYQHPAGYDGRERKKRIREDKAFIERQMSVSGYKYEVSAFHFIYNDPRSSWI